MPRPSGDPRATAEEAAPPAALTAEAPVPAPAAGREAGPPRPGPAPGAWPPGATPLAELALAVVRVGGTEVELRLAPEELGRLRFVLRPEGASLRLEVTAERPETLALLRQNAAALAEEFRALGYRQLILGFAAEAAAPPDAEAIVPSLPGPAPAQAPAAPPAAASAAPAGADAGGAGLAGGQEEGAARDGPALRRAPEAGAPPPGPGAAFAAAPPDPAVRAARARLDVRL